MQALHGGALPGECRIEHRTELVEVAGVGQLVTVQQHVDPDLPIVNHPSDKSLLDDLTRRHR